MFTHVPDTTRLLEHKLNLTTNEPVGSRPYPLPYALQEELKADIQDLLDLGVIWISISLYCSPVVVVKKKHGTNRVCIDYRQLKKITEFD